MLKNVKIENFRSFQSFELQQLGRVNLLVGTNNSGKTSILEAIQLLCSRNNLEPLAEVMINRGEYFFSEEDRRLLRDRRDIDICHLFYGHEIQAGSKFSISGINNNIREEVIGSIQVGSLPLDKDLTTGPDEQCNSFDENSFDETFNDLKKIDFTLQWNKESEIWKRPLSANAGISEHYIRRSPIKTKNSVTKTQFVTSSSLTTQKMTELFNQVVLTPEEELLTESLQTVEPKIKRIASIGTERYRPSDSRGGFFVRLSDTSQRVPIGSLGEGVWRMLGLALATVCASDGVLFIDDIDTGLHFSVMSDMWKLVCKTAERLNVQVFATTHNSDCWTSLANVAREEGGEDGITIQRIEKNKSTAVAFTEPEIIIAAQRGIEVR
ncbi:MAG: AAA family ATPase [Mastigocoleus sp. MO_167.B18]|nr:AAA family ATPase [Mastigocoleus sp. MO_167.B18]